MPGKKDPRKRLITYVATIAIGLYVSATGVAGLVPDAWAEWVVNVWCFGLIAFLFVGADRTERVEMITVVAIATPMELFFSEVWKIYEYQRGLMPLFVPVGHYLLFDAGRIISTKIKQTWVPWLLGPFVPAVGYGWISGGDTLAVGMLVLLVAFIYWEPQPALYVAVVWVTLAMELWGTYLGNWAWAREVPVTALTAWNPPLLVGSFYCIGNLFVKLAVAKLGGGEAES